MEEESKISQPSVNDHLANERTLLAWIRTSIGIMGFGFVVVKFSLFARELTTAVAEQQISPGAGYSRMVGILLVIVGALILLFSYLRYEQTKKQMELGLYQHSSAFNKIITIVLLLVSVLLVIYLMYTR